MQDLTTLEKIRQQIDQDNLAGDSQPPIKGNLDSPAVAESVVAEPMVTQDKYVIPNTESLGGIGSPFPVDLGYEAPSPQPTRQSFDLPEMSTIEKIKKQVDDASRLNGKCQKSKCF